jgi:hypothetical protein
MEALQKHLYMYFHTVCYFIQASWWRGFEDTPLGANYQNNPSASTTHSGSPF